MASCNSCPTAQKCTKDKESCMIENNPLNNVKQIIGVMSGKGGVGKSSICSLIAKTLKKQGYKVGVLDADITGPSIPRLLGVKDKRATYIEQGILSVQNKDGIKIMSLNLITDNEDDPVIWRGPMLSNMVKQFWTDVIWEDLDYLLIDMPPGTGDVALTVMQSIPINGVVMISVPQDLVSMIVSKAVKMTKKMNVRLLGVVENMSYIICEDCGKKIKLFDGESTNKFLQENNLKLFGELPMLSSISKLSQDNREKEDLDQVFNPIVKKIIDELNINK